MLTVLALAAGGCGEDDAGTSGELEGPAEEGTVEATASQGAAGAGPTSAPPSERLERWERERPDEPIRAAVVFGDVLGDSAVAVVLERHSVVPYRGFVRVAGLTTSHRVPPEDASLRFLDVLGNQVRTGLETSICAQPGRAAAMLERGGTSVERAREVLEQVERSVAAIRRLSDADAPYLYGVEVEGMVSDVRSLMAEPAVARVEPAALVDGEVVVPEPAAPPAGTESPGVGPGLGTLPADSVAARLGRLAEGLEGCGPGAGPPRPAGSDPSPARRGSDVSGR